jgi:hypothetical protein
MSQNQYSRLSNAARQLDIHEDIILDYVEQGLLSLSVLCQKVKGVITQGHRVGFATAIFNGFGTLCNTDAISIMNHGKANVSTLGMTPDCVSNLNYEYPFKAAMPNSLFDSWQNQIINNKERLSFYFHIRPVETTSSSGLASAFKSIQTSLEAKDALQIMQQNKDLYRGSIVITKEQLRIASHQIDKLKSLLTNEINNSDNILSEPKRPIDKLFVKMLINFPTLIPSKIWELLQQDVLQDERQYDTDEILDEVGEEIMYWFSPNGVTKNLTRKSFYNSLRTLRKLYSSKDS